MDYTNNLVELLGAIQVSLSSSAPGSATASADIVSLGEGSMWSTGTDIHRDRTSTVERIHSSEGLSETRGADVRAIDPDSNEGLGKQIHSAPADTLDSTDKPDHLETALLRKRVLETVESVPQIQVNENPSIPGEPCVNKRRPNVQIEDVPDEDELQHIHSLNDLDNKTENMATIKANLTFIDELLKDIEQSKSTRQRNASTDRWLGQIINNDEPSNNRSSQRKHKTKPKTAAKPATVRGGTRRKSPIKKNTSAKLTIASLNMNGRTFRSTNGPENKWNCVNELMAQNRLGMLTLQETHLDQTMLEDVQNFWKKELVIYNSPNPENPTGKGGVAIVLRKRSTNVTDVSFQTIIPGRAVLMQHPWHRDRIFTFLAIYAPAGSSEEKVQFYKQLNEEWDKRKLPNLDGLGGDFNLVLNAEDRLPTKTDNVEAQNALLNFTSRFHLVDGWREYHGNQQGFTFSRADCRSRIDRILLSKDLMRESQGWDIKTPCIATDHEMVMATISDPIAPHIGKGRWTVPLAVLKHKDFRNEVQRLLRSLQQHISQAASTDGWNQSSNKQTVWKTFKTDIKNLARDKAKQLIPKLKIKLEELTHERDAILNDNTLDDDVKLGKANKLDGKISELSNSMHIERKQFARATAHINNEKPTKWFSKRKQQHRPMEHITEFIRPNTVPPQTTNDTREMTRIADEYHDQLQNDIPDHGIDRDTAWESVKANVKTKASKEDRNKMAQFIKRRRVERALRTLKKGKASGLDGLPTELYQEMEDMHDLTKSSDHPLPSIVDILTEVYNDIEKFGIAPGTDFNQGWMCPIYKKKERNNIANYRPITVLNTDYKIFTKALTFKLTEITPEMINGDQAGFMKGRSIFDHIRLTEIVTEWAEEVEEDGVIIALDQEKAYDRIDHEYLWKILEEFNLPSHFIRTVKALYHNAQTLIVINGFISRGFTVRRGVRQGDPLSCLLFNLAIEPLAEMIRSSDEIKGIEIPIIREYLKVKLFADDTTVYLSKTDKFSELETILDTWCTVSTAKFNIEKTEVIPIGRKAFREELIKTRIMSPGHLPIPTHINIVPDGTTIRMLGGQIGNKKHPNAPWDPVLTKIRYALGLWKDVPLTLDGKVLVIQFELASRCQFTTAAQGMPDTVLKALNKTISDFLWNGKKPRVSRETLQRPVNQGGKNLVSLKNLRDAIDLMRMKTYLNFGPNRTAWTFFADDYYNRAVTVDGETRLPEKTLRENVFLQNWSVVTTKLPMYLKRTTLLARKYGVKIETALPSLEMCNAMPAWGHIGADNNKRQLNNVGRSQCLKTNHAVKTVGDLVQIVKRTGENTHNAGNNQCICHDCRVDRQCYCSSPADCTKHARKILDTLLPKWDPTRSTLLLSEDQVNDDADVGQSLRTLTRTCSVADGLRVFTNAKSFNSAPNPNPITIPLPDPSPMNTSLGQYTSSRNRTTTAVGSSLTPYHGNTLALTSKVPTQLAQSNLNALIVAALDAIRNASTANTLKISHASNPFDKILHEKLHLWERNGYIGIKNAEIIRPLTALIKQHHGKLHIVEIPESSPVGSSIEQANSVARNALTQHIATNPDLSIPDDFRTRGAQLLTSTQRLLYEGLRSLEFPKLKNKKRNAPQAKPKPYEKGLSDIRTELMNNGQTEPSDESIWLTCTKSRNATKDENIWSWKAIHDTFWVGEKWLHCKNVALHRRAKCQNCNVTDDMDHILLQCVKPGQELTWTLAKKFLSQRGITLPANLSWFSWFP